MSDESVSAALRSGSSLVVVEAPAGCGKTFQAVECARDLAPDIAPGRILILTHTHAACSVFSKRVKGIGGRVEIRTIDSLIGEIGTIYHSSLGLPPDIAAWARSRGSAGFNELASKVAALLLTCPMIAGAIARRYPLVFCDEHQDSSVDQHAIIMAFYQAGARLRVFADPMQRIFAKKGSHAQQAHVKRWREFTETADVCETLDKPHRWSNVNEDLGKWICRAREVLRSGDKIDLRKNLPCGLQLVFVENSSKSPRGYWLDKEDRPPIDAFMESNAHSSLLILAAHNETVRSIRALFWRRIPIWEGHTREAISALVERTQRGKGSAVEIVEAIVGFMGEVSRGFSQSSYGRYLLREVECQCSGRRRGKPAILQGLARIIIDAPDHKGVGQLLKRLEELIRGDHAFQDVKIDLRREFWEAVKLGDFDNPEEGLVEIARMRSRVQEGPSRNALSTVHKAKGLECESVVVMPCDSKHFPESSRCLLYVALSRASRSLQLVVSRNDPSPLLILP